MKTPKSIFLPLWAACCLLLLSAVCLAQGEEPVSHQLEGIQQQLDKTDKDMEDRKKELASDPSILALKQAWQTAKTTADDYYHSTNKKFPDGSSELADANGHQKTFDAAANSALDALKAARAGLFEKDPRLMELDSGRRALREKYNLLLSGARIRLLLLGVGCAKSLTSQTPLMEAKACLDQLFDGAQGHPATRIDSLQILGGRVPGSTPFFGGVSTHSGPAVIIEGLPVEDPERSAAKAAFWKKYFSEHPDQSHRYEDEKRWEQAHPPPPPPAILLKQTTIPATTQYIDAPSPASPSRAPSGMEIFNDKVRELLERIKQTIEPIRQKLTGDQAAIRG